MALSSALCASLATILIHRGLQGSSFWAGAWINVVVGAVAAWTAALILVPFDQYSWQAVPYFALSGLIGTTGGRLFRILAIQKVGAPAAAAVNNLTPLVASGLAILLLGEHVTAPIVAGTLVIVAGTILLSLSGRYVGFRVPHLAYPFIAASCFGIVQILRKLGLASAGPLLGATINGPDRVDHVHRRVGQARVAALQPAEPVLLHRRRHRRKCRGLLPAAGARLRRRQRGDSPRRHRPPLRPRPHLPLPERPRQARLAHRRGRGPDRGGRGPALAVTAGV